MMSLPIWPVPRLNKISPLVYFVVVEVARGGLEEALLVALQPLGVDLLVQSLNLLHVGREVQLLALPDFGELVSLVFLAPVSVVGVLKLRVLAKSR